jgi:hypothetical protein
MTPVPNLVIPAQAGIHPSRVPFVATHGERHARVVDSGLRRNDEQEPNVNLLASAHDQHPHR